MTNWTTASSLRHWQVLLVVLLAAALRFFQLGSQSVWYDEAHAVLFASKSLDWIFEHIPQDTMPPLHYVLLHFWLGLGRQEGIMRTLSALFSTGSVLMVYLLGCRLIDRKVALLGALFAALAPFQIYFAQEARMYAQLSFFSLLAAYLFVRAWQLKKRWGWAWVGFTLASAAAVYTHNLGFLTLAAVDAFALAMVLRKRLQLLPWLVSNGMVAILYIPWLYVLIKQVSAVKQSFWLAPPTVVTVPATLYSFVFAYTLNGVIFVVALFLVVLFVSLGLYLFVRGGKSHSIDRESLSFCLVMLFLPPLGTFLVSLVQPIYLDRALVGSSFFLYFFIAWAMLELRPSWLGRAFGVLLGVMLLLGLYDYYFVPSFGRPPMREAAADLQNAVKQGDLVLHTSDGSFLPFVFYDGGLDQHLVAGDPELAAGKVRSQALSTLGLQPEELADLVKGKKRFWLVVALDHSEEWQMAQWRQLDAAYRAVRTDDFGGIKVYLYEARSGEVG